ncbi:putative bifunctional diguanylate cyclase/phosphodiesterase [Persephonella sp.]
MIRDIFSLKAKEFYIGFLLISIIIFGYIYSIMPILEETFQRKLVNLTVESIEDLSENVIDHIKNLSEDGDIVESILKDSDFLEKTEKLLSILITKHTKYVYIVYKRGKTYRYLADGSREDRAIPGEIFEPLRSEIWDEVLETGKPRIIMQSNIDTIGFTYLKPIIQNDKVKAILAIDYSTKTIKEIKEIISTTKVLIEAILVTSFIFLNIIIYGAIKNIYLRKKAYIDNLTKTYNRNYLEDMASLLNPASYHIALIDLDDFKKVNDTYGHDVGDIVLKKVAETIKNSVRKDEDIVIRYGGEEFLVLIKAGRKDKKSSINAAERLLRDIRDLKIKINGEQISITASIGLNISTEKSHSIYDAIKKSDVALYQAKANGKNRIEIYSEKRSDQKGYITISEIQKFLEEKRFICHYQPIVDLQTNETSHYEALVRFVDQDGNIIYPDRFIHVIENTFLYSRLTKSVIEYNRNILNRYKDLKISINLSPSDLFTEAIIKLLEEIAVEDRLSNRLILEIIENESITSYEKMQNALLRLKSFGYKIGIDDFGSGYSNFIYLITLDVDFLKIDANIIKSIHKDRISYVVTETINNFCKKTDIKTVAEYVENEDIYELVKSLGIDYGQGYYFSKPLPLEDIIKQE